MSSSRWRLPGLFRDAWLPCAAALALALPACVTENAATGENIPRGKQRYEFAKVERAAEYLRVGMTRTEVLILLGSAAETGEQGDVWVWLPERYGVLVPARALQVRFRDGRVVEHGYRPIVLGATL